MAQTSTSTTQGMTETLSKGKPTGDELTDKRGKPDTATHCCCKAEQRQQAEGCASRRGFKMCRFKCSRHKGYIQVPKTTGHYKWNKKKCNRARILSLNSRTRNIVQYLNKKLNSRLNSRLYTTKELVNAKSGESFHRNTL